MHSEACFAEFAGVSMKSRVLGGQDMEAMWGNVGKENRKTLVECFLRGFPVPGAGIEPARIAPLVFETSASTDSAIRAG